MENNSAQGRSVGRALRVLELLAPERRGLRVTDIANSLGLNKAIVFRVLQDLKSNGYVDQDESNQRYFATFRLAAIGLRKLETGNLTQWAQEPLDRLAATTGELVRLAVAENDSLHWIAKAQGANSGLIVDPVAGKGVVLHATATGKAWLASLDDERVRTVLEKGGFVKRTENTITDVAVLLEELAKVRATGVALTFEEMDPGISAIAAPIVLPGTNGPAVGTVSVAGPATRLRPEILEAFAPEVKHTATELASRWSVYEHSPIGPFSVDEGGWSG